MKTSFGRKLMSNIPINPIQGMKNVGHNIHASATRKAPLSHAVRTRAGRQEWIDHVADGGKLAGFEYSPASVSKARVVGLGLGAYAVGNTAYRFASGGSMTRTREGKRNLVGIPII